jgi:uncharacterized membrane protein
VVSIVYEYYRNIQNNIVVIYEIKSFYITLAVKIFFQIIYIEQVTILPIVKKLKKPDYTTVLLLGSIVYSRKPLGRFIGLME